MRFFRFFLVPLLLCAACGDSSGSNPSGATAGATQQGGNSGQGGASNSSGNAGQSGGEQGGAGTQQGGTGGSEGGQSGSGGCDPTAPDAVGDGEDSNCDGLDGVDADGDGIASTSSGGTDCDDTDSSVFPGAPEGWKVEVVDVNRKELGCLPWSSTCTTLNAPSSMIVGPDGTVHLATTLSGKHSGLVGYVAGHDGQWSREVAGNKPGNEPQLALAPGGQLFLASVRPAKFGLDEIQVSVRDNSGAWGVETIPELDVPHHQANPRVAVDPSGVLHLLVTNRTSNASTGEDSSNKVYLFRREQSGYTSQQLSNETIERISGLSFAINSAGEFHGSYLDYGSTTVQSPADQRLRSWSQSSGGPSQPWTTADEDGFDGGTSLALAPDGAPLILYRASSGGDLVELRIASNQGGTWSSIPVPGAAGSGALAIDSKGAYHLCVVREKSLFYLVQQDGSWKEELILGNVGDSCLIARGPDDGIHVSFLSEKLIRHATPVPSPGVDRNCNGDDAT